MNSLTKLLESIPSCTACHLMADNQLRGVPYVPILSKTDAKYVFIGRDPSPNSVHIVGVRGGRSVFINEIFRLCNIAGVSEEMIYITNLCKCHWRTSVGTPYRGTENRSTKLDIGVAKKCFNKWLIRELEVLSPKIIVAFGEELYQLLLPSIGVPIQAPSKLSLRLDKSAMDAEKWYVENGCMELHLGVHRWPLAVLRHPGNSSRLSLKKEGDRRLEYHQAAVDRTIEYLKCGSI